MGFNNKLISDMLCENCSKLELITLLSHQEGKSGFGLGHSDSVATIVDGMKWLFSFHEGAITSYSNVFEGLVSGSSLVTLFGKSGENRDSGSITLEGMDIVINVSLTQSSYLLRGIFAWDDAVSIKD
ncbi:hypothetical protein DINM_005049 [Dirofilaria immitis]|nr:hypothetical protein [Dirofilaria immitis]